MATDDQVYHYDVPAGFPAMSLPTAKETRLPKDKIKLEAVTPDDLKEFVSLHKPALIRCTENDECVSVKLPMNPFQRPSGTA